MTKIVEVHDQKRIPIQNWTDNQKRAYIRKKGERRQDFLSWIQDAVDHKHKYFLVFLSSVGECIFSGYALSWENTTKAIKQRLKKSNVYQSDNADEFYCFVVINVEVERRILKKIKKKAKKR